MDNRFYENKYKKFKYIAGVDEVGRGPLFGPVVAAAVILPKDFSLEGLRDSKKVSKKNREKYAEIIKKEAIAYNIAVIDVDIINKVNIYEATKIAMMHAIEGLKVKPDVVLIDAMKLDIDILTESIIKGDDKSITISAASVIAKVYRDNLMLKYDVLYPEYDFKNNMGYGTKKHLEAIKKYGVTKYHRSDYAPVRKWLEEHDGKITR